ncbi:uncharacterized protein LOC106658548 [Trichogramma pretiosum]|uniref:uncharacterized protein LOC106658548 n=1 Tax=Trichogramma pretiosum TaxID=7493 RepID=UPI0006C9B1E1|nr:uncharacterized protein LOC106658548 [Trichogramma pretiosum]
MAYAVTPIKKNEQITISYSHMMNLILDARTRRLHLAQERKFICHCRGCVDEWLPMNPRWQTFAETLPPNNLQATSIDPTFSGNNWYLTTQQIINNKIIIELVYKHMYESSPAPRPFAIHIFVGSL